MSRVAVIILTYNNQAEIAACLRSVERQSYEGFYQIVVVDNNSQDRTREIVSQFPQVKLISLSENRGYAGGNNEGINWALQQGFDYLVVLNPDMEVDIDWLKYLVATADKYPQAGMVQAKVLFWQEKFRVNTVGNPLHFLGFSWAGGYKELSSKFQVEKKIAVASGSSVLLKAKALEQVGLFDDFYFMYHEDVDLSWRMHLAGFFIYLSPQAKAFHKYSFSFGSKKFYYVERNRLITIFAHYKLATLLVILPFLLFTEVAMIVYAAVTGWLKWKIKSYGGLCLAARHLLNKRKDSFARRRLSDQEMLRLMSSKLQFAEVDNIFLEFYSLLSKWYFVLMKKIIKW